MPTRSKQFKTVFQDSDDFGTLCICALRYCHGRQTYTSIVRDIIRPQLKEFSDKDISVMLSDCDYQERCDLYRHEIIDKPGWLAWKEELVLEQERRRLLT